MRRVSAKEITARLDKIANLVEERYAQLGMSRREAYDFCLYLDKTSDLIEEEELLEEEDRDAAVLIREEDEPYMDTFENAHEPIIVQEDEPYMDAFEEDPHTQLIEDEELTPLSDGTEITAGGNWYEQPSQRSASLNYNWYDAPTARRASSRRQGNWYE